MSCKFQLACEDWEPKIRGGWMLIEALRWGARLEGRSLRIEG